MNKPKENPPEDIYAFVVGGCPVEIGSMFKCYSAAKNSGINPDTHVFRYVLDRGYNK